MRSGASGLHLTKHENFHGGLDAISVGDGLFTILTTLSKRATSVQVMLQPILTYMACGYMGRQVSSLTLNTPVHTKLSYLELYIIWVGVIVPDCVPNHTSYLLFRTF